MKKVVEVVTTGIRDRYAHVQETKKHTEESVGQGREYVAAFVDYVHYVLGIHLAAIGKGAHRDEPEGSAAKQPHSHQEE